jgi:hypothetical protein
MESKLERFEPLTKLQSRQFYGNRDPKKIPDDILEIGDRARAQQREIDRLRGQLVESKQENRVISAKYGVATGILGGLAFKGLEVVLAHFLK